MTFSPSPTTADEIPAGLMLIPGTELDFLLPTQAVHLLGLGVSPDIADCWNPNGTPQQAIDSIRACGGRAVLAHPAWSLNTTELMCSFRGLSGVEIFNSVSSVPTNALRGDSAAMLDPVFANGQLLNCFANDDSHRYEGECGMSATMLNTNDRSVAGILRAIDEGRFYAWRAAYCVLAGKVHYFLQQRGVDSESHTGAGRADQCGLCGFTARIICTGAGCGGGWEIRMDIAN